MSTGGTTVVFCTACGAHNPPDARFCQTCGTAMATMAPLPVTASIAAYASHPYGGFWIRLVAWIIDVLIFYGVMLPLAFVSGFGLHLHFAGGALSLCGWWLYDAFLTSSSWQATLGKMAVRVRVTDLAGNRISFERATGRHFAKYLSALLLGIGYLMIAFTDRKQGLHDMLAGTLVQKNR
jgi:uncharacterized RDD family membrane protein YckC